MSDVIRQIKDSSFFEFRVHDFNDHEVELGTIGQRDWHLQLEKYSIADSNYLEIHFSNSMYNFPMRRWQYFLCVVNEDPSKNIQKLNKNCKGKEVKKLIRVIRLDEILAENSGFLIGGELIIRIEIRVLSLIDVRSGLNIANLCDPFENCVTIETDGIQYYANKQVMMTHCGLLRNRILDGQTQFSVSNLHLNWEDVHDVLQCIHGFVGCRYCTPFSREALIRLSFYWGIPINHWYLERICSRHRIPDDEVLYVDRRMKNQLKTVDSLKELKQLVLNWKLKKLSEEMIKAITQKFFSFTIDSEISRLKRVKNLEKLREIVEKWDLEDLELRLMMKSIYAFFSFAVPPKERSENVESAKSLEC